MTIICSQLLTRHRGLILPLDLNQQGQGDQVPQAVVVGRVMVGRGADGEAGQAVAGVVVVVAVVVEDS